MRTARNLVLTAVAGVIVAMAFASSASGQVTVRNEATGALCAGANCVLHANGEVALVGHVFGFPVTVSDCRLELTGRVNNGTGAGTITAATLSDHAGVDDCVRVPCATSGVMQPWPLQVGEGAAGVFTLNAEFCVQNGGTINRCAANLPVSYLGGDPGHHDYESVFPDLPGTPHGSIVDCELAGQLHLEGTPVELSHAG
jgi:hypothetical protein